MDTHSEKRKKERKKKQNVHVINNKKEKGGKTKEPKKQQKTKTKKNKEPNKTGEKNKTKHKTTQTDTKSNNTIPGGGKLWNAMNPGRRSISPPERYWVEMTSRFDRRDPQTLLPMMHSFSSPRQRKCRAVVAITGRQVIVDRECCCQCQRSARPTHQSGLAARSNWTNRLQT